MNGISANYNSKYYGENKTQSNPGFLSSTNLDTNIFYYNDHKQNHSHHTRLKFQSSDYYVEEFDKEQNKFLEKEGKKYSKMTFDMKDAGYALSLADDLKDAKKNILAGQVYRNVRDCVQNSENFSDLRVFDGTQSNPYPPELKDIVNPEDAQRYYNSDEGRKALFEIGAKDVKLLNGLTFSEINGQNCRLDMNEGGTLRFSFIQDNDAVHAWEYDLKTKPTIPAAETHEIKPPTSNTPSLKQSIAKKKEIEYDLYQYQNGTTEFANAKTHNLEDMSAKRLNEEQGKKVLEQFGINTNDYEYINGAFKNKNKNEFIGINDKGQIIHTVTDGKSRVHSALYEIDNSQQSDTKK